MPIIRVISGIALGLVPLAVLVVAAGAATGEPWVGPAVASTLVAGASAALVTGLIAVARGEGWSRTGTVVRLGAGLLLGTAILAAVWMPIVVRIGGDLWLAVDAAILIGSVAFVVLGIADLRRTDVRSTTMRGWMTVGAASLVALAVILALD